MHPSESSALDAAVGAIRAQTSVRPKVALILGSGLGPLADQVEGAAMLPYEDIPGFPVSTAPGHAGRLVVGHMQSQPVAVMAGRAHLYEGYTAHQIAFPIRVLRRLGAEILIATNAAGGINTSFVPGMLMLITDHINLTARNPLVGPNDQSFGPRFPDMSYAYDPELRDTARGVAARTGIPVTEGVYVAFLGPSYETPAEIRMARAIGGDAAGMSTVMEVIAANHAGMRVLGISCITNMAAGLLPQRLTEQEVVESAIAVREPFARLVKETLHELDVRS